MKKLNTTWSDVDSMKTLYRRRSSGSTSLTLVLVTTLLLLAGSIHPSIISAIYFLLFCSIMTLWSRLHTLTDAEVFRMMKALQVYTGAHLVTLYVYQFQILQRLLPPEHIVARYCYNIIIYGRNGVFLKWLATSMI